MKRGILAYLTPLLALFLATVAAYYSVFGLSRLYAGEAMAVIIMAGGIEAAKLLLASLIHSGWKTDHWLLKSILILFTVGIMALTSAGIYGFLTSAYQETSTAMQISDKEIKLVEGKKNTYYNKIERSDKQIEHKQIRIDQLVSIRTQQEARVDSLNNKNKTWTANKVRAQIKIGDADIKRLETEQSILLESINAYNDSISVLDIEILELESNNEASAELGPLKYIAELTGKGMDVVINWYTLVIIFVFDPVAVILIVKTNMIWARKEDGTNPVPKPAPSPVKPVPPKPIPTRPIVQPSITRHATPVSTITKPVQSNTGVPTTMPPTSNSTSTGKYIKPAKPATNGNAPAKKYHGVLNPKQARNKKGN